MGTESREATALGVKPITAAEVLESIDVRSVVHDLPQISLRKVVMPARLHLSWNMKTEFTGVSVKIQTL